jgi:hypothetical protein
MQYAEQHRRPQQRVRGLVTGERERAEFFRIGDAAFRGFIEDIPVQSDLS